MSTVAPVGLEDKVDLLMQQMSELGRQNAALLEEVRELRRENTHLRRELDKATGRQVLDPYADSSVRADRSDSVHNTMEQDPPLTPLRHDVDIVMDSNSPEPKREPKRAKPTVEAPGCDDA